MKVYYLLVSAVCIWIAPVNSQFYYSTFPNQLPQYVPQFISPVPYLTPQPPIPAASEYRGFGYHTNYQDGATSTVFYVTGPQSDNLRTVPELPNFSGHIQESRSFASDLLDKNALPGQTPKISNLLKPSDFQKLFHDMTGFVNFYTFPASTAPLLDVLKSNLTEVQPEPAESILVDAFVPNHIEPEVATTTEVTQNVTIESTTVSSTTETSTEASTENLDSIVVEAKSAEVAETTTIPSTTTNSTE